jgi:hypothetical protein
VTGFSFVVKLYNKGLHISDEPMGVSEEELTTARQELLKAKATYQVRNNVIKSVLIANPILKAVHGGKNATIAEQWVKKSRDTWSCAEMQ